MIHLKLCRLGARIHKFAIQMIRAIVLLAWGIGCQFAMALEEPAISNLRVALQAKYADLVEVKLNSVTEDVKFQIVDMRICKKPDCWHPQWSPKRLSQNRRAASVSTV